MIEKTVAVEIDAQFLHEIATARGAMDTRSEVVMVLPRPGGRVIVSRKVFYPEGTFRLPSGGIHPGESPEEAFVRETMEETGLSVSVDRKLARIVNHCVCGDDSVDITSHVFLGSPTTDPPCPIDEAEQLSDYREVDADGLCEIARHLRSLRVDSRGHEWWGFGRFRATANELVAELLAKVRSSLQ